MPSEAHAFLREEAGEGYPRIPPFTPLQRCYSGEKKLPGKVSKYDNEGENSESDEQMNYSGCTNENKSYQLRHTTATLESEEYKTTKDDNTLCMIDMDKKDDTIPLENNDKIECSSKDVDSIKQNQCIKFYNPPRHVFNLAVKVC